MTNIIDIGKGKRVADVTQRLIDVATKGDEVTSTTRELIQLFVDGKVPAKSVIQILAQNGLWEDMLLGAIAYSMGIIPTQAIVDEETTMQIDEALGLGWIPKDVSGLGVAVDELTAGNGGWIEWDGGGGTVENPVTPTGLDGRKIQVRFRSGYESKTTTSFGYAWYHENDESDIIAYRIVESEPT